MAEIIKCPNCKRELRLPEQFLGQKVQCPECQHMFVAASAAVSPQPLAAPAAPPEPKPARPRYDDDEDDRPRRRRRDEYDDDDDFDDFPPVRRGRSRLPPHRGGLIMALGLVALVGGLSFGLPAIIGPIAWGMGTWDLRQMHDGNMDPEGEGMTRAGQVCGLIATIIMILVLSMCGLMIWGGGF